MQKILNNNLKLNLKSKILESSYQIIIILVKGGIKICLSLINDIPTFLTFFFNSFSVNQ